MAIVAHYIFPGTNEDQTNFGTTLQHLPRIGERIRINKRERLYRVVDITYVYDGAGSFEVEIECL